MKFFLTILFFVSLTLSSVFAFSVNCNFLLLTTSESHSEQLIEIKNRALELKNSKQIFFIPKNCIDISAVKSSDSYALLLSSLDILILKIFLKWSFVIFAFLISVLLVYSSKILSKNNGKSVLQNLVVSFSYFIIACAPLLFFIRFSKNYFVFMISAGLLALFIVVSNLKGGVRIAFKDSFSTKIILFFLALFAYTFVIVDTIFFLSKCCIQ